MTTFVVSASNGRWSTRIVTVAELDRVLDDAVVAPGELPYSVAIIVADDSTADPVMMEIGVGHPERSFAFYTGGPDDGAWAYEAVVPEISGWIIDYGGQATDVADHQTRVTAATAREAARRFVATDGRRPGNLHWDGDPDAEQPDERQIDA